MASGISAILGAVSFFGALMFLLGIGLIVVSASQGRAVRGGVLLVILGIVVFFLFQLVSRGVIVVDPTEVAVVFQTLSGDLVEPRDEGTHVIIPVFNEAIFYPTNVQEYTMSGRSSEGAQQGDDAVQARTQDGQVVQMDITVFYRVQDNQVNELHQKWYNRNFGNSFNINVFENEFIRPTVRSLIRDVTSQYTAREIYGETRTQLRQEMETAVSARFDEEGLLLTDLLLRDVSFSQEFTSAIEQAQVSEQEALRAEIRVRQIEQEAEQRRVQAAGVRDANIVEAEGRAQATVLQAQAEAEALRLVSEQIAANPSLIQYLYVQNLSDNVNIALVPSGSPFLFDFDSLADADPNFVAPQSSNVEDFADSFEGDDDN